MSLKEKKNLSYRGQMFRQVGTIKASHLMRLHCDSVHSPKRSGNPCLNKGSDEQLQFFGLV